MSRVTSESESGMRQKSSHHNVSTLGSLKSLKSRRRSKSVSNVPSNFTPGPRTLMSTTKGRTPMAQYQPVQHASRSKYRTPMNSAMRLKAASADRIATITPKVNPSHPFSMLRHARAGEAVFSVTGSPIVPSKWVLKTQIISYYSDSPFSSVLWNIQLMLTFRLLMESCRFVLNQWILRLLIKVWFKKSTRIHSIIYAHWKQTWILSWQDSAENFNNKFS